MTTLYPLAALSASSAIIKRGASDVPLVVMVVICLALLVALLFRNSILDRQRKMLEESEAAFRISEELYRVAMSHSNLHVFRLDVNTSTAYVDENLSKKYMFPEELTCVPDSLILAGMVPRESVDAFEDFFARMRAGEPSGECIVLVNDPDKPHQEVWYRFEYTLAESESSRFAVIIYDDYTDKREKLIASKRLEHEIEMLDLKQVQVFEYNLTRDRTVSVRGSLLPMDNADDAPLNYRVEHWAKRHVLREDASQYVSFMNRDRLLTAFGDGVREKSLDLRVYLDSGGEYRWVRVNAQMQAFPGSDEVILYAVYRDIHETKVEELQLRALSEEDPLTGVYNRMTFEKTVRSVLECADHACHALIMIDMDGFKNVNDTFGHGVGDRVLINAAKSVKSMLRAGDVVGRIGGDEFMVLLRDIPGEEVVKKRAKLLNDILYSKIGDQVTVSASLGIAVFPKDGSTFESLYYSADMAVYYAKRHGRNRHAFYSASMKEETSPIVPTPIEKLVAGHDMDPIREKQIDQILMENEKLLAHQGEDERYRIVIEKMGITTFEWNELDKKFSASKSFGKYVLAHQSGELFFSDIVDLTGIHPDDRDRFRESFIRRAVSGHNVEGVEARLLLDAGGYVRRKVGAIVVTDGMNRLIKIIGMISSE